ncbi:hypothetical protein KXV85_002288, partial [Aspergillus fumigatus]
RRQRRAMQRQPAGPVRDRREQEAGDDGRQIAVQHLVHMPVARRECGRETQLAIERRQPDQDRQSRLDRAQQEERPEAGRKERPAPVRAIPGNAVRRMLAHCRRAAHLAAACCVRLAPIGGANAACDITFRSFLLRSLALRKLPLDCTASPSRFTRNSPEISPGGPMAAVDPSLVAGLPMFAGFSGDELAAILREARSAR